MPPLAIPQDLKIVARIFHNAGFQCWLVGGAIRDGQLNRKTDDFDLATDALPEEVIALFHRTIPTGIRHGTVSILLGSSCFETTTFRTDMAYSDGRRPDAVCYATDIHQDLARRDFTINAMAWDLVNHQILDPHGGQEDLKNRIIRAIGSPSKRFGEDALRRIRACRFASQLNFSIHPETLAAMALETSNMHGLSVERIWIEIQKILLSPTPSIAFKLFLETGLLKILLPELYAHKKDTSINQDIWTMALAACDAAPKNNLAVRAATLFYFIEKATPHTTESILRRYKASKTDLDRISRLVRHPMCRYTHNWTHAEVRHFMVKIGLDIWEDFLILCITMAKVSGIQESQEGLLELRSRIKAIIHCGDALSVKDLAINGQKLMRELRLKPSPLIGHLLDYLLNAVLQEPHQNTTEKLLKLAERWLLTNHCP